MPIASLSARQLRVLDIDLENRPLSYLGSDWTTDEITAVAWSWIGSGRVECWTLNLAGQFEAESGAVISAEEMFHAIWGFISAADMVTGHYIRRHDLPIINGALLEFGRPPLGDVLTQDTKMDLVSIKGMSKSQENLGEALGLFNPKVHMSQIQWRKANRLSPEGLRLTRERVVGDVLQHIEMRAALLKQGMLKAPEIWTP